MAKKIVIVAGEESGEKYGAMLVRALKEKLPETWFHGMGGEQMKEAGVSLINDIEKLTVVGLFEVLSNFKEIWKAYGNIKKHLSKEKPDLLILIDFPDFNIRLARFARKLGIRILYFISPQVWAWRKGRVKTLARLVNRMIVIFPFEVGFYEQFGIRADFVGHPLIDMAEAGMEREEMRRRIGVPDGNRLVGLLPGSRAGEVGRILPAMLGAAWLLHRQYERLSFLIPVARNVDRQMIDRYARPYRELSLFMTQGPYYDAVNALDLAVVASGTATVELALMNKPMVVVYRLNPLTYLLAKAFVKIEHVAMVNLIAGKKIVPELIQRDCNPDAICTALRAFLDDKEKFLSVKEELKTIREQLGEQGMFQRAAHIIEDFLCR